MPVLAWMNSRGWIANKSVKDTLDKRGNDVDTYDIPLIKMPKPMDESKIKELAFMHDIGDNAVEFVRAIEAEHGIVAL